MGLGQATVLSLAMQAMQGALSPAYTWVCRTLEASHK